MAFSLHSRGDIVSYLEREGFYIRDTEDTEDLRAAAALHAQAVAIQRSHVFRDVMTNAERVLRRATNPSNQDSTYGSMSGELSDDNELF